MRPWRPSLKLRLMLLITALIVLFCAAAGAYIVKRAQDDIRGEVFSATELIERFLEARLALARNSWRTNADSVPDLELAQLRDVRHVEVYFYNAVGVLLASSANDRAQTPVAPSWFIWLVQRSFTPIPDVRQFVDFDGYAAGVLVIHPNPDFEIDEIWNVTRGLLGLLVVFSILVNVLVWWAVGRALRPLVHIRTALSELSAGRLNASLPEMDLPELASLSKEFNFMARTLEQSTAENHRLTRRILEVQEEERERLARELHDEIGQCVTAIHADAFSIFRAGVAADGIIRESASAIMEVTSRIKNMVRGMLQRLRPAAIDRLGLEGALRGLETAFRQRNPQTNCALVMDIAANGLGSDVGVAVYRVIQEALTNVARHARARHVEIEVRVSPAPLDRASDALRITVRDDGVGFNQRAVAEGFGLLGMRERTAGFGGRMMIESVAGQGTEIRAEFPWPM
jgi:two-component system, NarL family, sensor histidine kinase UhpB